MALRIAYLILAHKCPAQVVRLVQRLQDPGRTFVIHVDRNSPTAEWNAARSMLSQSNVLWAERVACSWAAFSLVEATLNCITALQTAAIEADFVVLLSGQDYPIKSNEQIESFLASRLRAMPDVLSPLPLPRVELARILPPAHLANPLGREAAAHCARVSGSPFPEESPMTSSVRRFTMVGSAGRRGLYRLLEKFLRDHPEFLAYFRHSLFPDELVFHAILGNSRFPVNPGDHHLHFMRWENPPSPAVFV